jgi:2-keto-4-pentenoate hydratase
MLIQPRVEAEMAFVIGRDLAGPGVTTTNALTAIAGVLPAIEILDSRVADWRITLVDTIRRRAHPCARWGDHAGRIWAGRASGTASDASAAAVASAM